MAVWLKAGEDAIGIDDGIVRRADFAALMETCELAERAAVLLSQAAEEAVVLMSEATQNARNTLQGAEREAERLKAEAFSQGLQDAAARWAEDMTHKAFEAHQSVQRASERLAELVSLAAQRVIEVEDKNGLYRRALRTVSHLAKDSKTLVLHIGADDIDYARSAVAGIAAEMGIEVPLELKIDGSLTAGGCVLESDFGVIDASMGLQLEAVKQAISKAARSALIKNEQSQHSGEQADHGI